MNKRQKKDIIPDEKNNSKLIAIRDSRFFIELYLALRMNEFVDIIVNHQCHFAVVRERRGDEMHVKGNNTLISGLVCRPTRTKKYVKKSCEK